MADSATPAVSIARCGACGLELAPTALVCPSCHALVHASELRVLVARAEQSVTQDAIDDAVAAYRRALQLLPAGARQHRQITERIEALTPKLGKAPSSRRRQWLGAAGAGTGLLLWKLKGVILLLLGKAKFLFLGLTKAGTLLSMFASVGLYWALWGWPFAVGTVASIYVHEIGHVAALSRLGIRASAPMFIPGLGAVVRLKEYPATPAEDAEVGLAGPLWGLGAALAAFAIGHLGDFPMMLGIARFGAWLNLFNLVPFGSLDGGRGFRAMSRPMRWAATAACAASFVATGEGLLILLALVAAFRAFRGEMPARGSMSACVTYTLLVALLAALSDIAVPNAAAG